MEGVQVRHLLVFWQGMKMVLLLLLLLLLLLEQEERGSQLYSPPARLCKSVGAHCVSQRQGSP